MSEKEKMDKKFASAHGESQKITMQLMILTGDKIAKKHNYKSLKGLEAVYYYLIQKHNWLPSQVKSMNLEDLSFCLSEENL